MQVLRLISWFCLWPLTHQTQYRSVNQSTATLATKLSKQHSHNQLYTLLGLSCHRYFDSFIEQTLVHLQGPPLKYYTIRLKARKSQSSTQSTLLTQSIQSTLLTQSIQATLASYSCICSSQSTLKRPFTSFAKPVLLSVELPAALQVLENDRPSALKPIYPSRQKNR